MVVRGAAPNVAARMKLLPAFLRNHALPAFIAATLAWLLGRMVWMENIEGITLDARTRYRVSWQPPKADERQLVVAIDEDSLKKLGQWPFRRVVHGDLLQLVGLTKPAVVSWDILFTEPSKDDVDFIDGVKSSGANVVFGAMRADADIGKAPDDPTVKASSLAPIKRVSGDQSKLPVHPAVLLPVGDLAVAAKIAFVDTPPGADGVRRLVPLLVRLGDSVYPTLALQSLMQLWRVPPSGVEVRLGDAIALTGEGIARRIPINAEGQFLVNYRYGESGFHLVGYGDLLARLQARYVENDQKVSVPETNGRLLLVGQYADALSDMGPTPFSPLTPLVLVHGNVIDNVLREDYARRAPVWPIWLGVFALGTVGLAVFSKRKIGEQAAYALGLPLIYALVAALVWFKGSLWLPVVWPLLGFVSSQVFMIVRQMLAEQKQKEQIKGMFGSYVSPELVKRMTDSGQQPQLGGHEENITAYFSDIQGFSTFSEKLPPDRLVALMNEYLTACTDIVQEEGGTLDKYIGDAVVVMFGAPIALEDHAFRACVATQRVQVKLAELRVKWQAEGEKWPQIVWRMQSRIGLNSGRCIVGNMGSRTRFNYTMMGDDVNLAARMESGAKSWGAYTMCSEATKLECEKHGGDRVVFRPLGRIVVKGRNKPTPVHEIVGLKENVSAQARECVEIFGRAMERYYARDWAGATELFQRSLLLEPNQPGKTPGVTSNPSLVYIEKIVPEAIEEPPAEDWDGRYVMKEK
ncbi:MAG: Adenylate cyclase 2 [Verrucomicrobiota bacterium]